MAAAGLQGPRRVCLPLANPLPLCVVSSVDDDTHFHPSALSVVAFCLFFLPPFQPLTTLLSPSLHSTQQLEVYREEIAVGERAVTALKKKQAAYEERVNLVATEWNTLQEVGPVQVD